MGKQLEFKLQRQDSSFHFQSNHPGCLWAILHLLDFHRWHSVKNLLPHRTNGRFRHPKGYESSETVAKDHDAAQVPQYFNKKAQILLVEPETRNIAGPNKKFGKSVETVKKSKNSSEFEDKKRELRQVHLIDVDISDSWAKEPVEIMEMFNLNKKLFAEMLKGEELDPNKIFRSRNSNTKIGLRKSMSFPVVDPSGIRIHRPSKLEHKQNESFPKGKNTRPATPASKSSRNLREKSPDSGDSRREGKQQGWNQLVVNRFNSIKQKVKQAFRDRRKGYSKLSVKEIIPQSSDHPSMAEDGIIDIKTAEETDRPIKQPNFSIENLDRYEHLFAKSCSDHIKYRHSRSLTLASGNKILKNRLASRSFNRNLSSPDLELFCSFFHDVSLDSSQADKPIEKSLNRNSVTSTEELAVVASEIRTDEQDELVEDEFTSIEINPSQDLLSGCKLSDEMEFSESNQAVDDETCSPDHQTGSPELQIQEGTECKRIPMDEQMDSKDQPLFSSSDSTNKIFDKQDKDAESNGIKNAFYYQVRNIFEASGLIESDLVGERRSDGGKEIETELDQQLVFDLVNEALLDINGTSSTYFHKAFTFNRRILPPPTGDRLLEAVWKRVGPHWSPGQLGQSLEDVVARDLAKGDDGWMRLQLEAEFLALDVVDLIIDQLLGEFMCSY